MQLFHHAYTSRFLTRVTFGRTTSLSASWSSASGDTEFPQNWQIENGFRPESRPQMEHLMDGRKGGAYLT